MEATVNIGPPGGPCLWKKSVSGLRRRVRWRLPSARSTSGCSQVDDGSEAVQAAPHSSSPCSTRLLTNTEEHYCWIVNSNEIQDKDCDGNGKWGFLTTSNSVRTPSSPALYRHESRRVNIRRRELLSLAGCGLSLPLSGLKRCWGVSQEALIVLEAWKIVDENFLDESFGGNNWSKVKYEIMSKNDLKNRDGAYSAIQEMLGKLRDPYTRLLRPDEYEELRKGTIGVLFGIGLEVAFRRSDNVLVVVAPFPGGPADKAGLLPGDEIRSIDDQDISALSLYEISQRLQGPIGSRCIIDVRHPFEDFENISVIREQVPILPVQYRVCPVGLHEADQMEFSELFKNQQPVYRWANGALESDETHKKLAAVTESGCVGVENLGPDTRLSTSEEMNDKYPSNTLDIQQGSEIDINSIIDSDVNVVVENEGSKSSRKILDKINRDAFKNGLAGQVFQPNGDSDFKQFGCFAYIRISFFSRLTAKAVQAALCRLQEMNISGYIIDVRNNGGGLLESSIEVARLLLNEGEIVSIVSRDGTKQTFYASNSALVSRDCPLVLLVNRRTASASEVFVGALKENQRAIVVGERTCGKGVIQSVVPLSDGSAVAITVAKYKTPRKEYVNKIGIIPDRPSPYPLPIDDPDSFCDVLDFDVAKVLFRDP